MRERSSSPSDEESTSSPCWIGGALKKVYSISSLREMV